MDKIYQKLTQTLGEERVKKDISLADFSTLKVGGHTRYFYEALKTEDIINAVKTARQLSLPVFLLGGGTNLLISDREFKGLVIRNRTDKIKLIGFKGTRNKSASTVTDVYLEVDTGIYINRLVRYCLDEGLEGLENFLGQPGSIGGAIYINAHNMKKNDFFGDHIYQATILGNKSEIYIRPSSYFQFNYDKSIVQKSEEIILSVVLKLKKGIKETLWDKAKEVLEYRRKTQPQGVLSSGCTFKNISESDARRLATPNFTKSAGYLIERVGLKGKRIGDAQVSSVHANFIINLGRAKSSDVLELITLIKNRVKAQFNIILQEEVVLLGF